MYSIKMINFKTIIGLEVHVELKTSSKMFCPCSAEYFGTEPNSHTCPVCLGLPGALPVPNQKAIEWTILLGLALGCQIPEISKFDRKNYFYPDLPKGYQISQYDMPLAINGSLVIKEIATSPSAPRNDKIVRIRRVHLEEDTAKLIHGENATLIDFNRSGVPLVEIVTEPDFTSTEQVKEYLQKLQQIIRYLGISDADMEKGQMRCEPTVNLECEKAGEQEGEMVYTPLVEIKNINSFKFAQKAIDYEIQRQLEEFEKTGQEKQSGNKTTRGWDEVKQKTFLQRTKEEAEDYRYFPEPDIPPFQWTETEIRNSKFEIQKIELPDTKIKRYIKELGLTETNAIILTETKEKAEYFEKCVKLGQSDRLEPLEIANAIINKKVDSETLDPDQIIKLLATKKSAISLTESNLKKMIEQVLADNPKPVADYKGGKTPVLEYLIGQVARLTKGQAGPNLVRNILVEKLKN